MSWQLAVTFRDGCSVEPLQSVSQCSSLQRRAGARTRGQLRGLNRGVKWGKQGGSSQAMRHASVMAARDAWRY
jgi:hypothetical protein